MKRLVFTLLTAISLFGFFTDTTSAEENTEPTNTPPSTTEPSGETPPVSEDMATITFTYIDVDTNEEISSRKPVTDKLGTTILVDVKAISGYQVSDIMLVKEVDILTTDYTFPIRYVKIPSPSSSTSVSKESRITETTPTKATVVSQEPTDTSKQPNAKTAIDGDTEDSMSTQSASSDSGTATNESKATTTLNSSNSTSKVTGSTNLKKKKAITNKQTTGILPKAGSASNYFTSLIGLLTIVTSLVAYWFLKKKLA